MNGSFTCGCLIILVVAMSCKDIQDFDDSRANLDKSLSRLEGSWLAGSTHAVFKNDELAFYEHGNPLEYPAGKFRILDDEFGVLVLEDGEEEKFLYKFSGEELTIYFQRSGPITLTRE